MADINLENAQSQMRKGTLEFIILLIISNRGPVYASDILHKLKEAQLIVVEGTLYPLLSRLKNAGLLKYDWLESTEGPPRKYYSLTPKGQEVLNILQETWKKLDQSIKSLIKNK